MTRNKPKASKNLIETALFDTAFFPRGRKYPCFDMCLYSYKECYPGDCDSNGINGFWLDGWTNALTRPLNNSVLMPPTEGSGWETAYGQSLFSISRKELRGRAIRIKPWESAPIGTRRIHGQKDQKYAQSNIRSIDMSGELFRFKLYGDGAWMNRYGVYSHDLVVSKNRCLAISTSGVVLDTRIGMETRGEDMSGHVKNAIAMACGMQFVAEYLWKIVLQFEDGRPQISFSASKDLVQSVMKLRTETEREKKKRMIHIVSKHTRKNREGTSDNVMRHYRGGMEMLWQGCRAIIIPPVNETDSMEKFTDKIMEVREKTNRVLASR